MDPAQDVGSVAGTAMVVEVMAHAQHAIDGTARKSLQHTLQDDACSWNDHALLEPLGCSKCTC